MHPTSSAMAELLAQHPAAFQETVRRSSGSVNFRGTITAADAEHMAQQSGVTVCQVMLELLPFAALYAEPVISNFKVGAVAQGSSGNLYYGANMEFKSEALSFTVHAEQAAAMNAWMGGETGLSALAVSAAPCGYCRQFLYELATAATLKILLPDTKPTLLTWFLPDAFGPRNRGATWVQRRARGMVRLLQARGWRPALTRGLWVRRPPKAWRHARPGRVIREPDVSAASVPSGAPSR